ncbi:MAG TPA: hypothetical protein VGE07_20470 [Herpetosiphonaceae bacterium]
MFGAIVLRDIPKDEARIDLARLPIQGGFRGFGQVPAGWHYVGVKDGGHHRGFWCWVGPGEAVVRVFDDGFEEDEPESAAHYARLALGGAMGAALLPYPLERFGGWFGLVGKIPRENFPPAIRPDEQGGASRFELALQGSHGGDADSFLAEFQYAFAAWLVSLDTPVEDERAFARWRHLLLGCYNAGERGMAANPGLFAALAETLPRQFDLLPEAWFAADSFLMAQVDYLIEDMADCGAPELREPSAALADYLKPRRS